MGMERKGMDLQISHHAKSPPEGGDGVLNTPFCPVPICVFILDKPSRTNATGGLGQARRQILRRFLVRFRGVWDGKNRGFVCKGLSKSHFH